MRTVSRGVTVALVAAVTVPWAEARAQGEHPPGVHVDVSERFYDVEGVDLSSVIATLNAMRLEGPDGPPSQGLTEWHIRPRWRPAVGGGRCSVADLELDVTITITLPRWPGSERATPDERRRWSRISTAIREHEYGHRDLTLAAADELHASLSALESRGCGPLRQRFEGTLAITQGRIGRAHAGFDAETPRRLIG